MFSLGFAGTPPVLLTVDCVVNSVVEATATIDLILIDPSGRVYDVANGQCLIGAVAELQTDSDTGPDNNLDGVSEGSQLDRTPSSAPGKLWRSRAERGYIAARCRRRAGAGRPQLRVAAEARWHNRAESYVNAPSGCSQSGWLGPSKRLALEVDLAVGTARSMTPPEAKPSTTYPAFRLLALMQCSQRDPTRLATCVLRGRR